MKSRLSTSFTLLATILLVPAISLAETYVLCTTPKIYKDRTLKCHNVAGPYRADSPGDHQEKCKGKGETRVFNSESDALDWKSSNACGRMR